VTLLSTLLTDAVALAAMGGALYASPDRLDARRAGLRSGTRRPLPPPPGRRVPSLWTAAAAGALPFGRRLAPPLARSARWACRRDLRPLLVPSDASTTAAGRGRLVLGRAGRRLVAAEAGQSVVVFGPTQSGKTSSLVVPAILGWHGPVLATSVKTDLVDHTITHRRSCGPVAVVDPAGATGYDPVPWSPLPVSRTWPAARRTASALCDGPRRRSAP
jgi:type IV secretory system conjugative DNA transfer VirD4/TraG family protein